METKAETLLRQHWGSLQPRPVQWEIMAALASGQDVLAILPTGEGKSLCFQLGGLLRGGLTLVVSPLLALIEDQVQQLQARGIAAASLTSQQEAGQRQGVLRRLARLCFLYLSPEQLQSQSLGQALAACPPRMVVIDEAHCITLWGHDFRPAYRLVPRFIQQLPSRPVVAAFTATAPPEVALDIQTNLGLHQPLLVRHLPLRPHLALAVLRPWTPRGRWQLLLKLLLGRKTLIYANTRREIEALAQRLQGWSGPVFCYHAGLAPALRQPVFAGFRAAPAGILVASKAFGMGIDLPDIAQVIHWEPPESLLSYVQEAGRAGRGLGMPARAVLLATRGLSRARPGLALDRATLRAFLRALNQDNSLLKAQDRLGLEPALLQWLWGKLVEERLLVSLRPGEGRPLQPKLSHAQEYLILQGIRQLQKNRQDQARALQRYIGSRECRRILLARYFGCGDTAACGSCDRCGDGQAT